MADSCSRCIPQHALLPLSVYTAGSTGHIIFCRISQNMQFFHCFFTHTGCLNLVHAFIIAEHLFDCNGFSNIFSFRHFKCRNDEITYLTCPSLNCFIISLVRLNSPGCSSICSRCTHSAYFNSSASMVMVSSPSTSQ